MHHLELPTDQMFLWRDPHDFDQVCIGSKMQRRYVVWIACHADALLTIAGSELYDYVRDASDDQFPMPIRISIGFQH